ncbi:MAG: transglutaminase-like domain-containing protein, partial [Oscillospiraceae bacterium]
MKFIYAYMPIGDIASYDMSLFLKSIRDTLSAKLLLPWGKDVTGELFLNYVLSYRLNNEDIVDCRELFFNELFPRIRNLSMMQAAIEVNYWCFEKATYQATNSRTISPLGIIRNAFGRCGEESAFLVAALRSVGIPSRQCYTPRWAHCDDNHAWVEVWVDGKWSFLGACEPEPVMNKGWFVSPAQRAMLIHARVFSNIVNEPYITNQSPVMTQINILENYTTTKALCIKVIDKDNTPVQGAEVRFELINYAELFPLAVVKTNENGTANFQTGLGDLFIHINKDGKFINRKIDMRQCNDEVVFDWSQAVTSETQSVELDLCAPEALPVNDPEITKEMQAVHDEKISQAVEIRKAYIATFLHGDKAKEFGKTFTSNQDKIAELIAYANGNHNEIEKFLRADGELDQRVLLLSSLKTKDLSDSTAEILEEHLQYALKYKTTFSEEIYRDYILCPRV